jgi:hypothetical protein
MKPKNTPKKNKNCKTELRCKQDKKTWKYGYVDAQGNNVVPFIHDAATDFQDGYAMVYNFDEFLSCRKFIDHTGKVVLKLECQRAYVPILGKVPFCKKNKWGLIDIKDENVILPCEYSDLSIIDAIEKTVRKTIGILEKRKKFGLFDFHTNNFLIPCKYDEITPLFEGRKKLLQLRLKDKVEFADLDGIIFPTT